MRHSAVGDEGPDAARLDGPLELRGVVRAAAVDVEGAQARLREQLVDRRRRRPEVPRAAVVLERRRSGGASASVRAAPRSTCSSAPSTSILIRAGTRSAGSAESRSATPTVNGASSSAAKSSVLRLLRVSRPRTRWNVASPTWSETARLRTSTCRELSREPRRELGQRLEGDVPAARRERAPCRAGRRRRSRRRRCSTRPRRASAPSDAAATACRAGRAAPSRERRAWTSRRRSSIPRRRAASDQLMAPRRSCRRRACSST